MTKANLKVKLYKQDGKESGEVTLDSSVFGIEVKPTVVQQVVKAQLANARQVLAHTKTRGEVSGGGKKPWAQKGTGRARHGSSRSPIWVGGGITFGPRKNRNFSQKVNKKMKKIALFMCLSDKVNENNFIVVDALELTDAKTQSLKKIIDKLPGVKKNKMIVLAVQNQNFVKASLNLKNTKIILADSLNVVDVLKNQTMIIDQAGINKIIATYKK